MADISQIKLLDNTTYDIKDANVPHSSLPAASGGADLSLVTTGEKYTWSQGSSSYSLSTSGNDVVLSANGTAQDTITVPYATTAGSLQSNSFPDVTIDTTAMPVSGGKITGLTAGTSKIFTDGIGISNPATANDVGWIRVTGTGESDTVLELATGDDSGAGEQIVARQYNTSNAVAREVKILDTNGDTILPYEMKMSSASGQIQKKAVGSYCSSQTTVAALINEVRYSNGCCGSVNLTAYSGSPSSVGAGWYNFKYVPHRWGGNHGAADGDNCNYGTLTLYGMTVNGAYIIRFASGSIQYCREIYTPANASVNADANKLALRDGNGDSKFRYCYVTHINQSSSDQTTTYNYSNGYIMYCDSSNWVRKAKRYSQLWSGTFYNSGSISVAGYGVYSAFEVIGSPSVGQYGGYQTHIIPAATLSTGGWRYCFGDDTAYYTYIAKYSGSNFVINFHSRSHADGAIIRVFGIV